MSIKRGDPLYYENLFRPAFEVQQAYVTGAGALLTAASTLITSPTKAALAVSLVMCGFCAKRVAEAVPLLRKQMDIVRNDYLFEDIEKLRKWQAKNPDLVNLSYGFDWGTEHAQRAYHVNGMASTYEDIKLPFFMRRHLKEKIINSRELGGKPWINALGDEAPVIIDAGNFAGHTMITGLVGTGKTTMQSNLSSCAYQRGLSLIVLDPKNDSAWRKRLCNDMKAKGEEDRFFYFHPSKPSESVKIDPLENFTRTAEIADRICACFTGGGDSEAFIQFTWSMIDNVAKGMIYVGEKPQLITLMDYLLVNYLKLAEKVFERFYQKNYGAEWRHELEPQLKKYGKKIGLNNYTGFYQQDLPMEKKHPAVNAAIELVSHDREHMNRMIASTKPLLQQLTSDSLAELLSPNQTIDGEDQRRVVNTREFVEKGGILYIALDSMTSPRIASVIGKIILSDICAMAGDRYNHEDGEGRRVAVFVDEAHSCINEPLITLMAMGRAAGYEVYLSSQTLPDFDDAVGQDMANRLTGLCNNFISMRVSDKRTQEYASEQFGETTVRTMQRTVATGTSTDTGVGTFSSNYSERTTDTDKPAFPPYLLGDLPKLQFIARLSNGRKIKGRIPIYVPDPKKAMKSVISNRKKKIVPKAA